MNYKSKINTVKVFLGLEVKLESLKLVDGTVVEAEAFEPGFPVFIVNAEDGTKTLAPAGEHTLEDGKVIKVDEEGKLVEKTEVEMEEEEVKVPETSEVKVEAAEEVPAEEVKDAVKEEVKDDIKEAMKKLAMIVEEVAKEVTDIKTEMSDMKAKYEKFSKSPAASKFPSVTNGNVTPLNPLEAKLAALAELKKENFFRTN
jgi:hypothetical protein